MKHQLMTSKDCDFCKPGGSTYGDEYNCPICDWGLSICKVCGAAESELLDFPECLGREALNAWRSGRDKLLVSSWYPSMVDLSDEKQGYFVKRMMCYPNMLTDCTIFGFPNIYATYTLAVERAKELNMGG